VLQVVSVEPDAPERVDPENAAALPDHPAARRSYFSEMQTSSVSVEEDTIHETDGSAAERTAFL
jgi:hypothetical protein